EHSAERPGAVRHHPAAGDGGDHLHDARRAEAVRDGAGHDGGVLWADRDSVPVRQRGVRHLPGAGGRRAAGGGALHPVRRAAAGSHDGGGDRDGARPQGLLPSRGLRVRALAAGGQRVALPHRLRRAGAGQRDRPRAAPRCRHRQAAGPGDPLRHAV
ncbi:MAG: Membrane protein, distant similarity to thiosulphate:quinone oxidoreductase DoxD, partial [uncultured Gemmatimonadetes bacterium]